MNHSGHQAAHVANRGRPRLRCCLYRGELGADGLQVPVRSKGARASPAELFRGYNLKRTPSTAAGVNDLTPE